MRTIFLRENEIGDNFKERFRKISEGFPKVREEGGVTAKLYKGLIKGKSDLFTLAYYMDVRCAATDFATGEDDRVAVRGVR